MKISEKSYLDKYPQLAKKYLKIIRQHKLTPRQQQQDMTGDVYSALTGSKRALLESPTGTGKTLAYILAAAEFAELTGQQVVISVTRKDLQDQAVLTFNDMIAKEFDGLSIAVLKGKTNYLAMTCLQNLVESASETDRHTLEKFVKYAEEKGGDIESLREEFDTLGIQDTDINDLALSMSKASVDDEVFYQHAKNMATIASIVIVNHTLLGSLARSNGSGIPISLENLIIDEAHDLEDSVKLLFSDKVALSTISNGMKKLAADLIKDKKEFKGERPLVDAAQNAYWTIKEYSKDITGILSDYHEKGYFTVNDLPSQQHDAFLYKRLEGILSDIIISVREVTSKAAKKKDEMGRSSRSSYAHLIDAVSGLSGFANGFGKLRQQALELGAPQSKTISKDDSYYIITFSDVEAFPSLCRQKVDIGYWLHNLLWQNTKSVIMTSGTLTDGGSNSFGTFNYVKNATGIGISYKKEDFIERVYPKPFTWDKVQVILHTDAPSFNFTGDVANDAKMRATYIDYCAKQIARETVHSKTGALVLCPAQTDVVMLTKQLEKLTDRIVVVQNITHQSISACKREFSKVPSKTIMVSCGMWQGLDLPNEQLGDLFIVRVPWHNPNSPEFRAIIEMKQRYFDNSKNDKYLNLRAADIVMQQTASKVFNKFRQGLGRLCRKEGDKGRIHVLDSRVATGAQMYKPYMTYLKNWYKNISRCGAEKAA
jgi:ATP-dependent DNA helicase DinG